MKQYSPPWKPSQLPEFTLLKQAMAKKKRKPFLSIIKWNKFKDLLMLEYGSLQKFERAVQQQFLHLSQFSTKKEVAEILSPKIKELINTLDCMGIGQIP